MTFIPVFIFFFSSRVSDECVRIDSGVAREVFSSALSRSLIHRPEAIYFCERWIFGDRMLPDWCSLSASAGVLIRYLDVIRVYLFTSQSNKQTHLVDQREYRFEIKDSDRKNMTYLDKVKIFFFFQRSVFYLSRTLNNIHVSHEKKIPFPGLLVYLE